MFCWFMVFNATCKNISVIRGWGIQDFVLGGTKVGEGSGNRLRSSVGPGQSRGRVPRGALPLGAPGV